MPCTLAATEDWQVALIGAAPGTFLGGLALWRQHTGEDRARRERQQERLEEHQAEEQADMTARHVRRAAGTGTLYITNLGPGPARDVAATPAPPERGVFSVHIDPGLFPLATLHAGNSVDFSTLFGGAAGPQTVHIEWTDVRGRQQKDVTYTL